MRKYRKWDSEAT